MYKIYKYTLEHTEQGIIQEFDIPQNAWLLSSITQNNSVQLYFVVNSERPLETRKFVMYGTGRDIDCNLDELLFVGTIKSDDEAFVAHVFEIDPRE